jgi:manganese oxidase
MTTITEDGAPNAFSGLPVPRLRLRSPLRFVAAAAAATAGLAHVVEAEDQFHVAFWFGAAFAVVTIGLLFAAAMLVRADTRTAWRATGLVAASSVLVWLTGVAIGVPTRLDDLGRWTQPLAVVYLAAAGLVLVCGALALTRRVAGRFAPRASGGPAVLAGALVLVLGLTATGSAAAAHPTVATHAGMDMDSGYWATVSGGYHPTGTVRTYYIGADEVEWDYAPLGYNGITGAPFDDVADTYVKAGTGRIGSRYVKCLYRGYTDNSFTHLAARSTQDAYLGLLGPVIRAAVGDTVKVVFRNGCSIPASVHPHGVFYQKASEGAPYADNTSGADKTDDAVPHGGRHTYTWLVPDRAGPGPHDGSSVMWMYHSHTDEVGDTYAGLMGPMVITAAGKARPDGSPKDVDREVFELFSVMNENNSPYLETNLHRFAAPPYPDPDDEEFQESNLMHSVNGYVFGSQPMLMLTKGQRVRWYVMGMGTEVDLHTPHWHGNTVLVGGMRMDTVNLLPATMVTADMVPDDPGSWLFHCHVNDHLTAGMVTRYQVLA